MSAGFVKVVASKLVGKTVEIYQGNTHETVLWGEREVERKTVIRGILVEALEECLVIEVTDSGDTNHAYVNSWTVHSIIEVKNKMTIFDIYFPDERKQNK